MTTPLRQFRNAALCCLLLSLTLRAEAATFYVDSVGGNDASPGTSDQTAWNSVSKVNSVRLVAGDIVLFKRGLSYSGELSLGEDGVVGMPIRIGAYGSGAPPILSRLRIDGDFYIVEQLTIDHQKTSGDALRIRGGKHCILRQLVVRNGTSDGIDVADADNLLIEDSLVHHFLAGSFTSQADAHGIVATGTQGITIRNVEVHHVTGDSFQADPNREAGNITNDILIENSHFWTSPLSADFNSNWRAGERPGENAIDTKVLKSGWESAERMRITLKNITAHGWERDGYISNKAVFNMKEKVEAVFQGITVYDAEIAFRLRGTRGNANVTLKNVVVYNVEKALRAEDDLQNLKVLHNTFGEGVLQQIQFAGGSGGVASWELKNNAFLGVRPVQATGPSNLQAAAADFVDSSKADYHLPATSSLIGRGEFLSQVPIDRDGVSRDIPVDVGAYQYFVEDSLSPASPKNLRVEK